MRNVPGWAVGAIGVGVVAGAFFLGGRMNAADLSAGAKPALVSEATPGFQVECEPGQRAVLRQGTAASPSAATVACVTQFATYGDANYAVAAPQMPRTVPMNYVPAATRTTVAEPPVTRTVVQRAPARQPRSTKKSVAIIAGSTAAGAVIGGVAKGKKGAVIGGIVGGAAATIWDQITRRKST